jgi:hypothetical protein
MALVTLRVCDLCEPEALEPAEPAPISVNGMTTDTDLCAVHRRQRATALARFVDAARLVKPPAQKRTRRRASAKE